jgi:hypothetical protein
MERALADEVYWHCIACKQNSKTMFIEMAYHQCTQSIRWKQDEPFITYKWVKDEVN